MDNLLRLMKQDRLKKRFAILHKITLMKLKIYKVK